ncbi:hypothetical protein M427DRAFT_176202 [Gonapodya prolifera JEL478]|uniref:EngB-type G domain-containing protein n=1 Tax=Gonapodya prolifera (strain JEL478) TaxID=1344416 RepID=A0A139APY1_GONPJ|nr:hypothetical protein M427DRAFT_176202 [Gonapodya prolifera JEL478]|eukprot:KXS18796.1 hypothetical protein M427DRAFT_176202 [Gonapodya prolifera JEL478]
MHLSLPARRTAAPGVMGVAVVDMPGYGYAIGGDSERDRLSGLVLGFLKKRGESVRKSRPWVEKEDNEDKEKGKWGLKRVFVVLDARHGIKGNDEEVLKQLESLPLKYQLILTKTDLVPSATLSRLLTHLTALLPTRFPRCSLPIHLASSLTGAGIPELRRDIMHLAGAGRTAVDMAGRNVDPRDGKVSERERRSRKRVERRVKRERAKRAEQVRERMEKKEAREASGKAREATRGFKVVPKKVRHGGDVRGPRTQCIVVRKRLTR